MYIVFFLRAVNPESIIVNIVNQQGKEHILNKLYGKIREALGSVLPLALVVIALSAFCVPMPSDVLLMFLVGSVLLVIGMGIFSLGAEMAMIPMGEGVGKQLTKTQKLLFAILVCFVLGIIITVAEPALSVLAGQVPGVSAVTLVLTVGVGVGIFMVVGMLRPLLHIPLSYLFLGLYTVVFALAYFAPRSFIPVAFDSGGVTTGAITVPFIMSFGVGLASMRRGESSGEDNFGLIALCSIGPIMAVMLLGIIYAPENADLSSSSILMTNANSIQIARCFMLGLPAYVKEVVMALLPIILTFGAFQIAFAMFRRGSLMRIIVGVGYTFIGLATFLTGVNIGFMPAGHFIGKAIASGSFRWALPPLGFVIGYLLVNAEPAVHVLNRQVEDITGGMVTREAMRLSLAVGVGVAISLAMVRVLTGISIFWMVGIGYGTALLLTFFVPPIFTGIAFDSGGVASGVVTAAFMIPFAMGACEGVGGDVMKDAFGVVAMVAMTPLISIQLLGVLYRFRVASSAGVAVAPGYDNFVVVDYDLIPRMSEEENAK